MKKLKFSLMAAAFVCCIAACGNNNQNTDDIDSASLSTDPSMQGIDNTMVDTTGVTASDSVSIRMPMGDTANNRREGTGDSIP